MTTLQMLLENNSEWADDMVARDSKFFSRLSEQQNPNYLWIGCADSRVPANEIVGLLPGELFVHRNVANMVYHTDPNALSVIQYAVEYLEIQHIIVCGHYGCGGVEAATQHKELGQIDAWLRGIKDIYRDNVIELALLQGVEKVNRLCELNVCQQVRNVCTTPVVQKAWREGKSLTVHGWIYGLDNGKIKNLGVSISDASELEEIYRFYE